MYKTMRSLTQSVHKNGFRTFGAKSHTAGKSRICRCLYPISEAGWTSRKKVPLGVWLNQRDRGARGFDHETNQVFSSKVPLVNIVTRRRHAKRILYYQKTQMQRALPERQRKTRLHRSGRPSHRGWCGTIVRLCGPARRLANPCVARTSGAPSCALFHSPVPGPGHVTRYSANVPWRPRFS